MKLLLLRLNFFFVLLNLLFVKNLIAAKKLQSPAGYETVFSKRRENVWSCGRCVPPPPPAGPACFFTPAVNGMKLSGEDSTLWSIYCFRQVHRNLWINLYVRQLESDRLSTFESPINGHKDNHRRSTKVRSVQQPGKYPTRQLFLHTTLHVGPKPIATEWAPNSPGDHHLHCQVVTTCMSGPQIYFYNRPRKVKPA